MRVVDSVIGDDRETDDELVVWDDPETDDDTVNAVVESVTGDSVAFLFSSRTFRGSKIFSNVSPKISSFLDTIFCKYIYIFYYCTF